MRPLRIILLLAVLSFMLFIGSSHPVLHATTTSALDTAIVFPCVTNVAGFDTTITVGGDTSELEEDPHLDIYYYNMSGNLETTHPHRYTASQGDYTQWVLNLQTEAQLTGDNGMYIVLTNIPNPKASCTITDTAMTGVRASAPAIINPKIRGINQNNKIELLDSAQPPWDANDRDHCWDMLHPENGEVAPSMHHTTLFFPYVTGATAIGYDTGICISNIFDATNVPGGRKAHFYFYDTNGTLDSNSPWNVNIPAGNISGQYWFLMSLSPFAGKTGSLLAIVDVPYAYGFEFISYGGSGSGMGLPASTDNNIYAVDGTTGAPKRVFEPQVNRTSIVVPVIGTFGGFSTFVTLSNTVKLGGNATVDIFLYGMDGNIKTVRENEIDYKCHWQTQLVANNVNKMAIVCLTTTGVLVNEVPQPHSGIGEFAGWMLIVADAPGAHGAFFMMQPQNNIFDGGIGAIRNNITGVAKDENGEYTGEVLWDNPTPIDTPQMWDIPLAVRGYGGYASWSQTISPRGLGEHSGNIVHSYDGAKSDGTAIHDSVSFPPGSGAVIASIQHELFTSYDPSFVAFAEGQSNVCDEVPALYIGNGTDDGNFVLVWYETPEEGVAVDIQVEYLEPQFETDPGLILHAGEARYFWLAKDPKIADPLMLHIDTTDPADLFTVKRQASENPGVWETISLQGDAEVQPSYAADGKTETYRYMLIVKAGAAPSGPIMMKAYIQGHPEQNDIVKMYVLNNETDLQIMPRDFGNGHYIPVGSTRRQYIALRGWWLVDCYWQYWQPDPITVAFWNEATQEKCWTWNGNTVVVDPGDTPSTAVDGVTLYASDLATWERPPIDVDGQGVPTKPDIETDYKITILNPLDIRVDYLNENHEMDPGLILDSAGTDKRVFHIWSSIPDQSVHLQLDIGQPNDVFSFEWRPKGGDDDDWSAFNLDNDPPGETPPHYGRWPAWVQINDNYDYRFVPVPGAKGGPAHLSVSVTVGETEYRDDIKIYVIPDRDNLYIMPLNFGETGKFVPVNTSKEFVALRGYWTVNCDWCITDANGGANVSGASIDGQDASPYGGYYWIWNVPEIEMNAGATPSAAVNDVKLYAGQHGNPCLPPAGDDGADVETDYAFTIFTVDMDLAFWTEDGQDAWEDNPGGCVKVNDDDDNDNDESDYYENSNGVPGEDDLVGVILRTVPPEVSGQFLLHNYSEGMRLWENEDKTDMITSDVTTINVDANTATTVYVEGFDKSTAVRNEKIAVRWTGLPNSDLDTITFTSVWVHLISVQFENDHTIWPDNDGVNPYPKPQWWDRTWPPNGNADDSYEQKYPVCYTRSTATTPSYMTVNVVMIADPPDAFGPPVMYGQGPDGLVFEAEHAATLDDYTFTTNGIVSTALAGTVKYYGGDDILKIKWKISPNGGGSWMNAGTSDNTAYLILENHDPSTYMFETVIHIGCKNADGKDDPDDVFDALWSEFTDREVWRVGDRPDHPDPNHREPMKYWGGYCIGHSSDDEMHQTSGLVKHADGACDAWMHFFDDCMRAQGSDNCQLVLILPLNKSATIINDGLFVKKWDFSTTPPTDVLVGDIPGQNNPHPPSWFNLHYVIKWGDKIYDTSYGGDPFGTNATNALEKWQHVALDGFRFIDTSTSPVTITYEAEVEGELHVQPVYLKP